LPDRHGSAGTVTAIGTNRGGELEHLGVSAALLVEVGFKVSKFQSMAADETLKLLKHEI